jgi:4-hydroxy-tetrahydrodipicolinate reductase
VTTSVAVVGSTGKLGSQLCQLIRESDDFTLVAELRSTSDVGEVLAADIVVDVSLPQVSKSVIEFAVTHGKNILVGTSGWSRERIATLEPLFAAHPEVGVLFVPNFSLGSTVAAHVAAILAEHFDSIEIVETHGLTKVDSPSGTAVATAEKIAAVRAGDVVAPHAEQRARGELIEGVPVHSLRMAGTLAKQDVIFGGVGESVTISHLTTSNQSYAAGLMASLRKTVGLSGVVVGLDKVLDL